MAKLITYTSEIASSSEMELTICKNEDGGLYINLSPFLTHSSDEFIVLPPEDAIEIITNLAFQFGLIDNSPNIEGKMLWKGNDK